MKMNCYWAKVEGDHQVHALAYLPGTGFELQSFCGKYKDLKKETYPVDELPNKEYICHGCQGSARWNGIVGKLTASVFF